MRGCSRRGKRTDCTNIKTHRSLRARKARSVDPTGMRRRPMTRPCSGGGGGDDDDNDDDMQK